MNAGESLKAGWREIRTNKFRSVLSFSAISVGVASFLYTFAQTRGMNQATNRAIELMGPGRMSVTAKRDYVSRGLSPGLTWEDAEEIRRTLPELFMVYPKVRLWGAALRFGRDKVDGVPVNGVTPDWRKRDWVYTLRGRFLNDWDVKNAARVCVLVEPGGWVKKPFWASWWPVQPIDEFLGRHDLMGKRIVLADRVFAVVGVLREPPKDKDPRWFHWETVSVLVPVTAYHRYLRGEGSQAKGPTGIEEIQVDTGDERTVPAVKRRIEAVLKRRHHGEEDYEIEDSREMIQGEMNETRQYVLIGTVLGAVAMLAGGIGIMNVTLATIFSRIKEIGVRRAVGATRADILGQFVTEAMFLGAAGGAAGIPLGMAGVSYLARQADRDLASMTWWHMAAAFAIAVVISCLFSLYPAWAASKLDPVEALRDDA